MEPQPWTAEARSWPPLMCMVCYGDGLLTLRVHTNDYIVTNCDEHSAEHG